MIYRKFKIDQKIYAQISIEDKKVLRLLESAVKDLSPVYEKQLQEGFYPKGVSKEKIEATARMNSSILSPFTSVEIKDRELRAIPYHEKYKDLLLPIAEKIEKAAKISSNKSFKKYLLARAKSLRDGSYREADITWFNVKNCNIDFSVGPFERYLDKMFFIKRAFQAHVGIIDKEYSQKVEKIKTSLYSSASLSFDKYHSTEIPKKGVSIFVEWTPAVSGYISDALFLGEHFPCDLSLMQQYGSIILIYATQISIKFEKLHYPIFKKIFEKKFALKYSKELLLKSIAWNVILYELGRQLHKFAGARERLKELYGPIDEANGMVSGIQHCKYLVMKGLISQEELGAIIIMHIVKMFANWLTYDKSPGLDSHIVGNAIVLNTYIQRGALKEQNGISWPNFSKIFFEIEDLANELVSLLYGGSYQDAAKLIKQKSSFDNFEKLSKNIQNLHAQDLK